MDSPSPKAVLNPKSPKRPRSRLSSLLPFKALRKSYDNTTPDEQSRPQTPSATSTISSNRPSLKKKVSGMFGKRNSSLGTDFMPGEYYTNGHEAGQTNTATETVEEDRSATPTPIENMPTMTKRKSGTFWRRKSSLGLGTALENETPGWSAAQKENSIDIDAAHANGNGNGAKRPVSSENEQNYRDGDGVVIPGIAQVNTEKSLPESPPLSPLVQRSDSPPPQLPEFVGGGGDLGCEEMFRDFGID